MILLPQTLHALCSIKDANKDEELVLNDLPLGIVYESSTDKVHCNDDDSCRNFSFSGCYMVHCQGARSCFGARFEGNDVVSCRADQACAAAFFEASTHVMCGDGYTNSCADTRIKVSSIGLCNGPKACVSDLDEHEITFVLDKTGVVACANGKGRYSCQHLTVYVDHERRACFGLGTDVNEIGDCAVMCQTENDCNYDTIEFIH
ncbi:hypothetical protein ACA910_011223 [Epithemia clementina (nom. ined.)]